MMGYRIHYWLTLGLAGLALGLVIANIWLNLGNAERQKEVNSRQSMIQQTQQVDFPLYRELAQAMAELAQRGDGQIGYMLSAQGIQWNASQAPAANAAQTDPNRAKAKPQAPATPSSKP